MAFFVKLELLFARCVFTLQLYGENYEKKAVIDLFFRVVIGLVCRV